MIDIKKLKISYENISLVDISFKINSSIALVGESGSGKSLTLKALLNMLPTNLRVEKEIEYEFELDSNTIGFIPQNPFLSLSTMTKIKDQMFCEFSKVEEVFKLLNLSLDILEKYPSQISGGQVQRVVIAIAISRDIKLLLLDEPTTALDFENKTNIINIVNSLKEQLGIKILFVTHDIATIENICDDIMILKNGKIIESGTTKEILENPQTAYTKLLISSSFKNKEFRK
ncbi:MULTISPECIES: ATP-binding cassette domain-containing protein [Aliarcobacter]|jgi:peptide/nickel transport system ATP-binding protein|uniref:ABC transporter ATP-binding protein n=2 Tax=Aliarcobacter skirrowii TaxID=28200 RepID=A0AAD0WNB3_9BACT|nr:ATP-binding cassette domain-containing protein [Aliarcobacter skirrowii]AXX84310.1 ABC transporter, ATP-binding protein [Aliarcobacter skirrowii CCUG 10374]KAB0621512.1 ABC transporter ATP-binding protein [Aliarcobacter skirrowii CCUG 10374]MDD2507938.1 ATP-binding cassette domain-containing protein [Aliarcobacter skirrowii]MDD3496374.1 ATP-binding cassette domain-containing protein [Aliarcobacter skirrowii]MDX4038955.1 ATP-binding cassette domain-containing protein [Aliarcobacter skirrowii